MGLVERKFVDYFLNEYHLSRGENMDFNQVVKGPYGPLEVCINGHVFRVNWNERMKDYHPLCGQRTFERKRVLQLSSDHEVYPLYMDGIVASGKMQTRIGNIVIWEDGIKAYPTIVVGADRSYNFQIDIFCLTDDRIEFALDLRTHQNNVIEHMFYYSTSSSQMIFDGDCHIQEIPECVMDWIFEISNLLPMQNQTPEGLALHTLFSTVTTEMFYQKMDKNRMRRHISYMYPKLLFYLQEEACLICEDVSTELGLSDTSVMLKLVKKNAPCIYQKVE